MNRMGMGVVAVSVVFALLNRAAAQEPKLRATLDAKRYVSRIDFQPDGKFLAAGGQNGAIEIWDLTAGKVVTTLKAPPGFVLDVKYSPDGKLLAAAANQSVVVWTVADGKQVAAFDKLDGTPPMIGFSGERFSKTSRLTGRPCFTTYRTFFNGVGFRNIWWDKTNSM